MSKYENLNPVKNPELAEELLNKNKSFLGSIEQQQQYILKLHVHPMPCPVCLKSCNVYEAADGTKTVGSHYEGEYRCPSCGVELKHTVPFILQPGTPGWHWSRKHPPTEEEIKRLKELHA